MSTKDVQLEWRRSKVIELKSIGLSQIEIARELQVSKQSISADVQYLREQAKANIKQYTTDHLPEQYQICLAALDTILKNAFVIMTKSEDNREKLQALQLFKDTHMTKLELLSNGTTIDSALQFIRNKQQEHKHKKESDDNDDDDCSQVTTTAATTTTAAGRQSVF